MTTGETEMGTAFKSLLTDYARYNEWANREYINWLRAKPAHVWNKETPSSFPTLQKTLEHIWKTQVFWLNVLQCSEEPFQEGDINLFEEQPETSMEQICSRLLEQSERITHFMQDMDEGALLEKMFIETPWFQSCQPRYELLQHAMNHSTYHRGQMVTMGRNLGITDAPMADFNFYLLQIK